MVLSSSIPGAAYRSRGLGRPDLRPIGFDNRVRRGVAPGHEPLATAEAVEPPLDLFAANVLSQVDVVSPRRVRHWAVRPRIVLPAEPVLVGASRTPIWTAQQKRHPPTPRSPTLLPR